MRQLQLVKETVEIGMDPAGHVTHASCAHFSTYFKKHTRGMEIRCSTWLDAALWIHSPYRPVGTERPSLRGGTSPDSLGVCVYEGVGSTPLRRTHLCAALWRKKRGLPVLLGIEQGMHCLEGVPISSSLPARSGQIVNFVRPVPPKDVKI